MAKKSEILLIYTGGTIGMMRDEASGTLRPFDFKNMSRHIPEIKKIPANISTHSFKNPIDSSDMQPKTWVEIAEIVFRNYKTYDGFVILHGSDTMAYTASALSFMFSNLSKPIILTGSQLPIGILRTDGKENLITAIEMACLKNKKGSLLKEVCIYFEYKLFRGNRCFKFNADQFNAFQSPNFPELGNAGVEIVINEKLLLKPGKGKPVLFSELNDRIGVLKVFPGMRPDFAGSVLENKNLNGIVLETFGAGNATRSSWFLKMLEQTVKRGVPILNISQCPAGKIEPGKYETGEGLKKAGVLNGSDLTFEAAVTKMMVVLGLKLSYKKTCAMLTESIRGEMS